MNIEYPPIVRYGTISTERCWSSRLPFSTYTRSINRWIKRDEEVVLIPFSPHKVKLKHFSTESDKVWWNKAQCSKKISKSSSSAICLCTKILKDLVLRALNIWTIPPHHMHQMHALCAVVNNNRWTSSVYKHLSVPHRFLSVSLLSESWSQYSAGNNGTCTAIFSTAIWGVSTFALTKYCDQNRVCNFRGN